MAILFNLVKPTINRDQGFDLPAIYNEILPVTGDCSLQTSDHSALTIVAFAGRSGPDEKACVTSHYDSER